MKYSQIEAMLNEMKIEDFEELAMQTEYARLATHQDLNPIFEPDAGAFFCHGAWWMMKKIVEAAK